MVAAHPRDKCLWRCNLSPRLVWKILLQMAQFPDFVQCWCSQRCSHDHNYCRLSCCQNAVYFGFAGYSNWLYAVAEVTHAGNCIAINKIRWQLGGFAHVFFKTTTYHDDVEAIWPSFFASAARFLIEIFIKRFSETLSATERVLHEKNQY